MVDPKDFANLGLWQALVIEPNGKIPLRFAYRLDLFWRELPPPQVSLDGIGLFVSLRWQTHDHPRAWDAKLPRYRLAVVPVEDVPVLVHFDRDTDPIGCNETTEGVALLSGEGR